jgi:hypothetical protein
LKQSETRDQTRKGAKINGSNYNSSGGLDYKIVKTAKDRIENIHFQNFWLPTHSPCTREEIHACFRLFIRVTGLVQWPSQAYGVQPRPMGRAGPNKKNSNMWFFQNILLYFDQYWFVFLYCKDTNPVLKYQVFVKIKKKYFLFSCIRLSLSKIYIKNSYCIFI